MVNYSYTYTGSRNENQISKKILEKWLIMGYSVRAGNYNKAVFIWNNKFKRYCKRHNKENFGGQK